MITGCLLRDAFISAAVTIANKKREVDELNVYPVPDGDTGTNMSMTMSAAVAELKRLDDNVSAAEVTSVTASALLRGARGNSVPTSSPMPRISAAFTVRLFNAS